MISSNTKISLRSILSHSVRRSVHTKICGAKSTIAAAAMLILLTARPAVSGVVFENKPELKNYTDEVTMQPKTKPQMTNGNTKKAPVATTSTPQKIIRSETTSSEGLSPQAFALPGTVV